MSRRRRAFKREIEPDPLYASYILEKFINKVMLSGKKSIARQIVYQSLEKFAKQIKAEDPIVAFEEALENAKPSLEVKSRRIGGATYQVPVEIAPDRRIALAMKWIIITARDKPGRCMSDKLASEFKDCYQNLGTVIRKKEEMHRMAESNRAFAHYKW